MKRWTRGRGKMSTRRKRRAKGRMKTLDKKEEVAKEIWLPILLHPLVDLLTTCEAFVANYFSSKLHHHTGVTNLHLVTALRTFTPSALACLGAYCERCTARTIGQSAKVCIPHICHRHHRHVCVNFYRFNAKNWRFRQILREKVAFFFTDLTQKIGVFRCKFYSPKILPV